MPDTTQPPAETLAEATNRLQFEADFQRKYGSARVSIRRDDADTILAALTRRAGGDAIPACWVSPGQFEALGPDPDDAGGAAYLPLRKTSAGLFTMPLYATLKPPAGGDAIPTGMKPWHGGDAAPADWDGGPVMRRHGGLSMPSGDFAWISNGGGLDNVIAYTPKPSARPDYEPAWRELHDALSWMQGNRQLSAYIGWNLAAIANDLIDRAYPGLRNGSAALDDRPADEDINPYLPDHLQAEKRLGVQRSAWLTSWFIPWSPRNCNENAEGPWSHWVAFAHAIIEADRAARAKLVADKEASV